MDVFYNKHSLLFELCFWQVARKHHPVQYPKPDGIFSFDVPTSLHRFLNINFFSIHNFIFRFIREGNGDVTQKTLLHCPLLSSRSCNIDWRRDIDAIFLANLCFFNFVLWLHYSDLSQSCACSSRNFVIKPKVLVLKCELSMLK